MNIQYPSEHKWVEEIKEDSMSELGKNNRARLRATLSKIESTSISYTIVPLTLEVLEWFTPLYQEQIGSKENPKIHNIFDNTLGKNSIYPYFALVLSEDNVPVGATIFSKRKSILSIAYRIYPQNWGANNVQASPSLYTEYLLNKYGYEQGYRKLSHGKDRNPYGMNASIGLALFKLSVGCNIYIPSTPFEINTLNLDKVTEDILVLELPSGDEKRITQGYLCVTNESLTRYENVTKYPERVNIKVVLRDNQPNL